MVKVTMLEQTKYYQDPWKRFLKKIIHKVNYLQNISFESLEALVYKIKEESFDEDNIIVRPGDLTNKLYLISEGEVDIIFKHQDKEFVIETLGPGSNFGAMKIIQDSEQFDYYAKSKSGTTCQVLSKESLDEVSRGFYEIERIIQNQELVIMRHGFPTCDFTLVVNLKMGKYRIPWKEVVER
jgi:CRP-like cAMP-binding protein